MRDYKHVTVPEPYRFRTKRKTVKRVRAERNKGWSGKGPRGVTGMARGFLVFLLVAAAGWLGYSATLGAELLQIAGVDVQGVKHISEAELKEIVGVFTGQNIFRVDLGTAVRRAQANGWVREARIHRSLPNRITLVVTERVPYAILDNGGARYLMDEQGTIIERLTRETDKRWPLPIVAIKTDLARPGEQVTAEGAQEAFELLAEIAARGGWKPVDVTIRAGSSEQLAVLYAEHEFKIGNGNYPEKLRRLAEIMSDVKQRGLEIASVDLRPERQAAVMVKNAGIKGQGSRVRKKRGA
jgi:cell division septal protein FtsQ